jgi:hypothetical protein
MVQRKRRLCAQPLCQDCLAKGLITAATTPDHIIPWLRVAPIPKTTSGACAPHAIVSGQHSSSGIECLSR